MRTCGPCRLCCAVFPLPVLDKPAGVECRHACSAGCAVHGTGAQPEVCREYSCWWLDHESLVDGCRPDLLGIVVTESGTVSVGGREMPVLVATLARPGADRGPAAREMLDGFIAAGFAALLLDGPEMRVVYDRARYPVIEPEDIEAAFRRERLRDADELRRLGAVDGAFGS